MKVTIRKRFDDFKSLGLSCPPEEGMTQQHFKDECDINYLLKHYNDIPVPPPVYGDCTQYNDLQKCIDKVLAANEDFAAVPSEIRARFGNNPAAFFDFCNDFSNYEELVKLGLAESRTSSLDVTGPTDSKTVSNSPSANQEKE